jgi:hypothetical protein
VACEVKLAGYAELGRLATGGQDERLARVLRSVVGAYHVALAVDSNAGHLAPGDIASYLAELLLERLWPVLRRECPGTRVNLR